MSPWVRMPAGKDALERAALDELRLGLEAARCAAELTANGGASACDRQLAQAVLAALERAEAALDRLHVRVH